LVKSALARTVDDFRAAGKGKLPERPSGDSLRRARPAAEGLLIVYPIDPRSFELESREAMPVVGYAVVFPHSDRAERIRYRVNQVFIEGLQNAIEDPEDVD